MQFQLVDVLPIALPLSELSRGQEGKEPPRPELEGLRRTGNATIGGGNKAPTDAGVGCAISVTVCAKARFGGPFFDGDQPDRQKRSLASITDR
jgi:hypothetical protein